MSRKGVLLSNAANTSTLLKISTAIKAIKKTP